jgi:predicted MPP superfamily phosphohydrolase
MPFFVIFFSIYGGINLYAFLKARAALEFGARTGSLLALFLLLMVAAPALVRYAERAGYGQLARVGAYAGYLWLGFIFLFFCSSVLFDFYNVLAYPAGLLLKHRLSIPAKVSFLVPAAMAALICIYGYFEAFDIRPVRLEVRSPKIKTRLRIVQISDVHLGLIVGRDKLARALALVKASDPDLFISTGDLVDGQKNGLQGLDVMLAQIKPRYGSIAILGNHEYYGGLSESVSFTQKSGFTLLRDKSMEIAGINITGLDDPAGKPYGQDNDEAEHRLLMSEPKGKFTLLLKHRPVALSASAGLFDLQLSGHAHGGQIFPFSLVTRHYYVSDHGYRALDKKGDSGIYVSRGTGTWGPPIRFLAPPEVTVIDLVPEPMER